ncbi:MAG: ACR3 family arsenite efflux transporter [Thermodesulfobacteriota bacterium]|nr:ACR3 family arsenite efflux transporter [Thermodesulfobacteriota bacterium]
MPEERKLSVFEKYLTLWVFLCMVAGSLLGSWFPNVSLFLDKLSYAQVNLPIAVCLFFMIYPIMVKIDFANVIKAGRTPKPVGLTLFVNWCIKPFTMFAIAYFFLGFVFKDFLLDTEIVRGEVTPLYRSYISGCILLGIAPCTAMVLVWGFLARGNDAHTLVMTAINSLTMLVFYAPLGGWLLNENEMPVPWKTIILSVFIYVGLPLVAGYFSRKLILKQKGEQWFKEKFLHVLAPISIVALLVTLIVLFALKGEILLTKPLHVVFIAIPLFIQTCFIFAITYALAKIMNLTYEDAAPSAMIGASNHFEVAIATSVMLFGLASGAALATVVGVLIEVPVMLMLVGICKGTRNLFPSAKVEEMNY